MNNNKNDNNSVFNEFNAKIDRLLAALQAFPGKVHEQPLDVFFKNLRTNIKSPFLLVVVGEVNAGKSKFINALIGRHASEEGVLTCTNDIKKITYSDGIEIIDTPGVKSKEEDRSQRHREVTQQFIPNSDLIIFVIPSTASENESAWFLLDDVSNKWMRKVIFVISKSDLMADASELDIVKDSVRRYAKTKNIEVLGVFTTAARWKTNGQVEDEKTTGFDAIRAFIRDKITSKKIYASKLESIMTVTGQTLAIIKECLDKEKDLKRKLKKRLVDCKDSKYKHVEDFIHSMVDIYTKDIVDELKNNLPVFTVLKKKTFLKTWLKNLQDRFETKLEAVFHDKRHAYSAEFAADIDALMVLYKQHLVAVKENRNQVILGNKTIKVDIEHFNSELIAAMTAVRQKLGDYFRQHSETLIADDYFTKLVTSSKQQKESMVGSEKEIFGISIINLIAGFIAFLLIALDVRETGGILTLCGIVAIAVYSFGRKKFKIRKFDRIIKAKAFQAASCQQACADIDDIFRRLTSEFGSFFTAVDNKHKELAVLRSDFDDIQKMLLTDNK